jgi:hypothetical protein
MLLRNRAINEKEKKYPSLVEWLLWWSWSRFEKRLAKQLHELD